MPSNPFYPMTNEALKGIAAQSSTADIHYPELAIQGNFTKNSGYAMTKVEDDPWWIVTFNNVVLVRVVYIQSPEAYRKLNNNNNLLSNITTLYIYIYIYICIK